MQTPNPCRSMRRIVISARVPPFSDAARRTRPPEPRTVRMPKRSTTAALISASKLRDRSAM